MVMERDVYKRQGASGLFPLVPQHIGTYAVGAVVRPYIGNAQTGHTRTCLLYTSILENTPYVCGGTHWNFIDFSSALRDESMPRINNKGLAYSCLLYTSALGIRIEKV